MNRQLNRILLLQSASIGSDRSHILAVSISRDVTNHRHHPRSNQMSLLRPRVRSVLLHLKMLISFFLLSASQFKRITHDTSRNVNNSRKEKAFSLQTSLGDSSVACSLNRTIWAAGKGGESIGRSATIK